MEISYLEDMMVMETSLLNDIKELVASLLMLNLVGIFLMMIMESVKRMSMRMKKKLILRKVEEQKRMIASLENKRVLKKSQKKKEVVVLDKSEIVNVFTKKLTLPFISLEHPCTCTSILGRNHTMEVEEQGEIVGKDPFVNPSLLSDEVSFEKLKLLLESYISHLSIIGDACSISFCGGLFLVCLMNHRCIMVLNSILLAIVLGY
ncbi:hypothetical protein M9H77_16695 [Catharanthus roseus]|uniref:Uncharacterized protein n=1 Tax=Catharanthus roseus TaxID=4058 RepID=A0ACC0B2I1_CATRO|nr:hypothetical protein M9H77_16695 [Catharanthus roseus]